MTNVRRILSSVLFALGVLMVFIGVSAALNFTAGGMLATTLAIGALLYAGAVWFAPSQAIGSPKRLPQSIIVFDRDRRIVAGPSVGESLSTQFPEAVRIDIEHRCAAALTGATIRFSCAHDGKVVTFDALPVRTADGAVIYGILIFADPLPAVAATA